MKHGQPITIVPAGFMGMKDKTVGFTPEGQVIIAQDSTYEICFKFASAVEEKMGNEEGQDGNQPEENDGGLRESAAESGAGHQESDGRTQDFVSGTGDTSGVAGHNHKEKGKQR